MDIEQAIETIYTGLVSEESVPVKLRAFRELDREMLGQVQEALSFAIEYYKGKSLVPKKLAMGNGRYFWCSFALIVVLEKRAERA